MQNLEVKDTIQKIKETKSEIKKELEELIANGKRNEHTDMEEQPENGTTNEEDAAKAIQEFEEIIKNKKSHIVWLAYYQGKIFQRFREKERFVSHMVKVSKSKIMFKTALSRLIDDYPKNKRLVAVSSLFKKKLKMIKKVCKENASEFK